MRYWAALILPLFLSGAALGTVQTMLFGVPKFVGGSSTATSFAEPRFVANQGLGEPGSRFGHMLALISALVLLLSSVPTIAEPPINDDCQNPLDIVDGSYDFSTIDALTDGPDGSSCVTFGSEQTWNDIWYRYVAPIDGILVISTCGTVNYDSRIIVYTGDCENLVEYACNDDGAGCPGYSSYLLCHCVAGAEYLVRVGGYSEGNTGTGSFGIKSSPPCESTCPSEASFELELCGDDNNNGCGGAGGADGIAEVLEPGTPICGAWHCDGMHRDTDWYSVTVPEPGGLITAELFSSDRVIGYVFLARESCPSNVISYSFGGCPTPLNSAWLDPGEYRIIVAPGFDQVIECGDSGGTDLYTLTVDVTDGGVTVPNNDLCETAEVIANGTWPFSTLLAGTDGPPDSPDDCGVFGSGIGADIWYRYTASCEGLVTVSTCDSADFDTRLEIWEGGCGGALIACNDDGDECAGYTSAVSFSGVCGVEYLIRLGGYQGKWGTGDLTITCEGTCDCNDNGSPDQEDLDLGTSQDCDANGIPDECDLVAGGIDADCNENGILDVCDIGDGNFVDASGDGILDICQCDLHPEACCPGDLDGDGMVAGADLSIVLGAWGTDDPVADLDGDGLVSGTDLAMVLGAWGDC